jgi:hypothetical protein
MHLSCCKKFGGQLDHQTLESFSQLYLLAEDKEEVFLRLLKLPICRFSRKSGSPLSIEMLQSKVYQWYLKGSSFIDDQWMRRMLVEMGIEENERRIFHIMEDVCSKAEKSGWQMCGSCSSQLI